MAKKKKKSKAVGDARGYGQTTVFRETPKPSPGDPSTNSQEQKLPVANADNQAVVDDWDEAIEQNRQETQALVDPKQNVLVTKKVPPRATVQLPSTFFTTGGSSSSQRNPSTIVLSSTMHALLEDLLECLTWQEFISDSSLRTDAYPADRLVKKLAYLYDYLVVAGFSWENIRRAVKALSGCEGKAIELGAVLDWLCYCLDLEQLPVRFLEGREALIREEATEKARKRGVDVSPVASAAVKAGNNNFVDQESDSTTDVQKREGEQGSPVEPSSTRVPRDEERSNTVEDSVQCGAPEPTKSCVPEKTEDEERLQELEKLLTQLSFDLKDDASNYFRSKGEIKELEKERKTVKKELQRLKGKIDKARAAERRQETTTEGAESLQEDLFVGGFFGEEAPEPTVSTDSLPRINVPKDAIPKSWTGRTPTELLEERCRRLKLPRPTFQKLDRNGCRIVIRGSRRVDVEEVAVFDSKMDGQHYVATKALYELDPTLPIYRSLPPYYHDLWKGWISEVENAKDEKEEAEGEIRKKRILEILSTAELQSMDPTTTEDLEIDVEQKIKSFESTLFTCPKPNMSAIEKENGRLQAEFHERCKMKSYREFLAHRKKLPIYEFRDNILSTVRQNSVTVLCAETGAGKTTNVGQFILEQALKEGTGARTSVICTQPRRVAATSVAERVSEEMGVNLGDLVGYSIRLENRRSSQTRLLFCTTGVILRRLIEDPLLVGISHVIVDEVHERQWQIDVLLVALRNLVNGRRQDLKVVLMSATLDAKLFCAFFGAPLINVPGRTFPVSEYFLEDVIESTGHIVEDDSRNALRDYYRSETTQLQVTTKGGRERKQTVSLDSEVDPTLSGAYEGYSLETRRTMDRVDESVLNFALIEDVLHLLLIEPKANHTLKTPEGQFIERGAILIFLPGIGEIRTLSDRLRASRFFNDGRTFEIIPMHSALSSTEQRRAFVVPRRVRWAIIPTTNVAETSVTIPDVVCVIDSGRVREVRHDKRTFTRKLVTTWCSKASTKQRMGRAGRVQQGICLKLFSSFTSHRIMSPTTLPELQRLPLEEVCLTILAGGLAPRGCMAFLSQTPQPPKPDSVQAALLSLEQVGAIVVPSRDESTTHSEKLTPLGLQLVKLPVDARLGKMLLLSVQFQCVDTITTIVAGLSASQSPFLSSLRDVAASKAKQAKFRHENSDFLTLVNLYNAFIETGESFTFCRDNYASFSALREMKEARRHYFDLLRGMKLIDKDRSCNANGQNEVVLHAVIGAALSQMARVDRAPGGKDTLWIGTTDQQVQVHNSSVNASLPPVLPSRWLVFFEKFATSSRVSISTTAFCNPLSLVLMVGHDFQIQHAARQVILDGWMEVGLAATTAVKLRALRNQLSALHKQERFVAGVVALLKEDAAAAALREPETSSRT